MIDREPDRLTRLIKDAIYIRKEGAQSMNRDEGSYQLKSRIWPLSWHVKFKFSLCQQPEELATASSSDNKRSLMKTEASRKKVRILVVLMNF